MKANVFNPFDYLSKTLIDAYYQLEGSCSSSNKKIHATRVMSKHIRAVLSFIKPFFKNSEFIESQKEFYKQLSKNLEQKRDMQVLSNTLDFVIKKKELQSDDFKNIKKYIDDDINLLNEKTNHIDATEESILKAFGSLCAYKHVHISKKDIDKRLEKTYNKTSQLLNIAIKTNKMEDIHNFRKYAKRYMYQLESLENIVHCPQKLRKKLDSLTVVLGKIHDIDLFEQYIQKHKNEKEFLSLKNHIDSLQKKLIKKAFKKSKEIFKK